MAGENINRRLNIYINDKEVVNSLGGVTSAIAKTKNELKRLVKGSDDYDSEVKRLTDRLATLTKHQDEFKEELKLTNKEMGAAKDNFSNLLTGLKSGDMKAVQTGMIGIRASIMESTAAAWAFVTTPIGAFVAAFVGLGLAAKEVFDFNESIKESNQLLDSLGVDKKLRPAIQGIVDTYKIGFNDLAKAIDDMTDLGLVKDSAEALKQIQEGLVKAPDKNEFLATLKENGVAAKNLGLTLQDVINLNQSFENTGGNASAIFASLQKSSSTLILQSPQLRRSLENSFGAAFTNDLLTKVKTGAITYYDALDKIYKKGEEVSLSNQKQAQLAKDLFGKSAIAAGGYEMILGNVAAAQSKNITALTETQKEIKKLAEANVALAESEDRALRADGYNRWRNNALIAIIGVKKAWYDFINFITSSSDSRNNDARIEGQLQGQKLSSTLIGDKTGEDAKKAAESNTRIALNNIKTLMQAVKEAEAEVSKAKKESFAVFGESINESVAQENKKKLMRQLGEAEGLYKASRKVITDLNKKPVINENAGNELTDAEKKAIEDAAKKRAKDLEDAKKHHEDLLKELEKSQKDLLASQRAYEDSSLSSEKDSYEKELKLLNIEYNRKIEDTKIKVSELQTEINKLNQDLNDPKNTKSDNEVIRSTIAEKIATQKQYSNMSVSIEETRNIKIGILQEKYLEKSFQKQQEKSASELQNLRTRQTLELAQITSFAQAKGILAKSLSSDELRKITTLEEAKTVIKKQNLKEQYDLELKNLNDLVALLETSLTPNITNGFTILSEDEKAKVLKFLEDAKAKIAEITGNKTDANAPKKLEGVDILGFNSSQWEEVFSNLDNFQNKIAAIQMVAASLTTAFSSYFKFIEAGEARTLQKFQKSADLKKKHLSDQLDKGVISQEVYNARVAKIESDLARKKADIEYKQAKRQKAMAIVNAIVNTAVGIMQAYSQLGPIGGTVAAVLVGAMGALEVATIAKQPLPDKNGFKKGGFTGDGSNTGVAGDVHFREYVIPEDVLFSNDPVVPNIVGYLEQKRTGKQPAQPEDTSAPISNSQNSSSSTQDNSATAILLARAIVILEKLDKDGFVGYLVNDIPTAKKIRDKIKELTKLETKAKP